MTKRNIKILTAAIYRIIEKYDKLNYVNPDKQIIIDCVERSLVTKKPLEFVEFTCSTINSSYMFSRITPEKYVSLSPNGNNLTEDLLTLTKFLKEIKKTYPVKLIIIIGNTDPYYIYTCSWSLLPWFSNDTLWKKYSARWLKYKNNLDIWLKKRLPDINYNLISWYDLEMKQYKIRNYFDQQFTSTLNNITQYFRNDLFIWELKRLSENFGPNKYFEGLEKPPVYLINEWVRRKFSEYAVQGLWLKRLFPLAIFLQNEKPSLLRTQMYQPLIVDQLGTRLPVIYPFGVDNKGFR